MNIVHVLFGERPTPRPETLSTPPAGVRMRTVKAREAPAKRAWLAESDAQVDTEHGVLQAHGGKDYVLAQRERYQRYLRSPLPDELQIAGLLKEIEELAERSRIHVAEVKPLPPEGDESTRRYSLDVQFDCTLEEWVDFIIEVEASPSLFQIVRSTLAMQEDVPDRLKGSLRVVSAALRPKPEGHADAGAGRYAAAR